MGRKVARKYPKRDSSEEVRNVLVDYAGKSTISKNTSKSFKKRKGGNTNSNKTLSLAKHELTYLPDELFQDDTALGKKILDSVSSLNLAHNSLTCVPKSIANLKHISRLVYPTIQSRVFRKK